MSLASTALTGLVASVPLFVSWSAYATTSAYLKPTDKVEIQVENQSGVSFTEMNLEPFLQCSTKNPEGGGESGTYTNTAENNFLVNSYGLPGDVVTLSVQNELQSSVEAPKKKSIFSSSKCEAGAWLTFKIEGEDYNPDFGMDHPDSFWAPMGVATSHGANVDLTGDWVRSLKGHYTVRLVYGGEMSDGSGRVPYCRLVLFKGSKEIGSSLRYMKANCNP